MSEASDDGSEALLCGGPAFRALRKWGKPEHWLRSRGVSNAIRARNLGLEWSGVTRGGRARERGFSRAGLCGKGREGRRSEVK